MGIKIDIKGLYEVLDATPAEQNIMISGRHGIGKSEILKHYFHAKGHKVQTLFLGQMSDPGDIIGLPAIDRKNGKTEFMLPYWWPSDGKPIVLFLDELNRARPEILQTVMDLALNRKLAGKSLPEGSRIISAVNDGEEYQLTDLDPALVSRFNIYWFCPGIDEWLLWAQKSGIDEKVISFISENPDMLDGAEFKREDQGLEKTPDRRAWEKVSSVMNNIKEAKPVHKKIIGGIVGARAASKFFEFFSAKRLLSAKEILLGSFNTAKSRMSSYKTTDFAAINDSLFRFLETKEYQTKDASRVAENLEAYFDYLAERNMREAQAHFTNCYSDTNYPGAIVFVMTICLTLFQKINSFIKSI